MFIISDNPSTPAQGVWDRVIEFNLQSENDNEIAQKMDNICEWISHNFSKNFVLIEFSHSCLAGGYSDNRSGWDNYKAGKDVRYSHVNRYDDKTISKYELRCSGPDATLFLLKYLKETI